MPTVTSVRGARSDHGLSTTVVRGARSTHGWVKAVRGARSAHGLSTTVVRGARSSQWAREFFDFFIARLEE